MTPRLRAPGFISAERSSNAGDEVTYSFTTTNVGTVTLVDVTITETDFTGSGTVSDITCDIDVPIASAPGDVLNCTSTRTIIQADVDAGFVNNTALAEGFNIGGDPFTDEDDTTVQVDGTPGLDLEKDVAPTSKVAAGDEVTDTFTATNTGNVTLSDVSIEEVDFDGSGELSDLACTPEQPRVVGPGRCAGLHRDLRGDRGRRRGRIDHQRGRCGWHTS